MKPIGEIEKRHDSPSCSWPDLLNLTAAELRHPATSFSFAWKDKSLFNDLHPNLGRAAHPNWPCRTTAQIDRAAFHEWAMIVDSNDDRMAIARIRIRTERGLFTVDLTLAATPTALEQLEALGRFGSR